MTYGLVPFHYILIAYNEVNIYLKINIEFQEISGSYIRVTIVRKLAVVLVISNIGDFFIDVFPCHFIVEDGIFFSIDYGLCTMDYRLIFIS